MEVFGFVLILEELKNHSIWRWTNTKSRRFCQVVRM